MAVKETAWEHEINKYCTTYQATEIGRVTSALSNQRHLNLHTPSVFKLFSPLTF
jgi:hypothetical protein